MQIIDNLSIFQALVFILTNESIIKQKQNITRTTLVKVLKLQIKLFSCLLAGVEKNLKIFKF